MSRSLRSFAVLARQAMQQAETQGSMLQQRRCYESVGRYSPKPFSRETPADRAATVVPKNPYVEAWAWRRDNLDREFTWSFRHSVEAGYFLVGLSAAFFVLTAWSVRHSDSRSGYPRREMLWSDHGTGWVNPDEREFY